MVINGYERLLSNLFKSIAFDCDNELSYWKIISNLHDGSIFFANLSCTSQRGLNKQSTGLLRRDGLYKQIDFNSIDQVFVSSVAINTNKILENI